MLSIFIKIGVWVGVVVSVIGLTALLPALNLGAYAVAGMNFFVELIAPLNFIFPFEAFFTILGYIFLFEVILFIMKGILLVIRLLPFT